MNAQEAGGSPDAPRKTEPRPNLDGGTFLATDYLNHFNEVIMLLELVRTLPGSLDELLAWEPYGYVEHFQRSNFSARHAVLDAYRTAPAIVRESFDGIVADMIAIVRLIQAALRTESRPEVQARLAVSAAERLKPLVVAAAAVIHGRMDTVWHRSQWEIDDVLRTVA
jgi:hypothetical protein